MSELHADWESQRIRALDIGDAERYNMLCDKLSVSRRSLESPELYDRGRQLELDLTRSLESSVESEEVKPIGKPRTRVVKTETYRAFLDKASNIPESDVGAMRDVLFRFFNYKFGPHGSTPIRNMTDYQVKGTFRGNMAYAKQRLEHQ